MHVWASFKIPHKISYQYIEMCAAYSQIEILEHLDLKVLRFKSV